jgi:hypothetical protein
MHLRQNRLQIKKTVYFTGYMTTEEDSRKLMKLVKIPPEIAGSELKIHANNVLICARPCPASVLEKVGGMGSKMLWEATGTGCFEDSIWAACVRPVPPTAPYHTDNPSPLVVLALKKGARPVDAGRIEHWQPLAAGQSFVFETTVGQKSVLRVEEEDPREDEYESLFANKTSKRKRPGDGGRMASSTHGQYGGRNESRGYHSGSRGGRARGTTSRGFRGGARGAGRGAGRGRGGGGHHYRSLDDVDPQIQQIHYQDTHSGPPTGPKASLGRGAPYQGRGGGRGGSRGGQGRAMGGGQAANNNPDLQNYY